MVLARVELDTGREVRLERIYVEATYYGFLEGGSFASPPINSDPEMDVSVLVVGWFQDDPSVRDAPAELRAIPWDELAHEGPH
ncbi:hypothetical protein [Actinocrispum sp. NPDC049592]|uniref:hypothetical protein n=1 Tax=Actinocrispum sp. NPDC049592 TaxID=3154835 RepID=UPI003438F10C